MPGRRAARGLAGIGMVALLLTDPRATPGLAAQPGRPPSLSSSLNDVLARAGRYTVAYGLALTSVLAEEAYTQRLVWRSTKTAMSERRLRSEIAFVRLVDSSEWLAFRNVLALNDAPIPKSDGRLERLLRGSQRSLLEEARLIAGESARYNLGPITREINVPTTALHFVHPQHRPNCRFDKESEETLDGERVWIVRYKERDRGGLISRGDGRNLPAEGRLWIVPADGRVVRSELVVKDFVRGGSDSRAEIRVRWRRDEPLDLWVPAEMSEHYSGPWQALSASKKRERYDIDGVATYSNYRRFTVDVRIR
jgi:hypothetical protein